MSKRINNISSSFSTILILLSSLTYIYGDEPDKSDKVLQVHVNFRHGDRTTDFTESYPTDPNRNISFYPLSVGHLTNAGKMKSYKLGKMLRERYKTFLGDIYDSEIVQAITTDFDRTKMSLLVVLAGLFPPTAVQQWNNELPWQPIPYEYQKHKEDIFLKRPNDYCPEYMEELTKIFDTDGKAMLKNYKEIIHYIEKNSGQKMNTLLDVFRMQQTIYSQETMNLTIPDWMKKIYPDPLSDLAAKQCYFENSNTLLKRLNGGNLLRKYVTNAQQKIDGTLNPKGRKIYLYSGHETNVLNVLAALDIWDNKIPLFGSAHIFELVYRKKTNEYGVKIYYHDQISETPKLLKLKNCDTFCEFHKFLKLTDDVIPKNYTLECGSAIDIHTFPWP